MKVQAFDKLKTKEKILLIEDMGELVFSMEFYEHRIYLFSFNAMFIEVYKNLESGAVESINSIELSDLDKFLSQITLGNLVREAYIL
jgi:hypothetical protein